MRKLLFILAIILSLCFTPLAAAETQTINTLPSANATFISDLQDFLRDEQPARDPITLRQVVSGCLGPTDATLSHTITACVAMPNHYYVSQASVSHTYTASTDTFVYVRDDDARVVTIPGFSITYDGNFVFAEGVNGSAQPATPTGTLELFEAVTNGTAITSVDDLRSGGIAVLSNFAGLSDAVSTLGSTLFVELLINQDARLTAATTITSNISVTVLPGSRFILDAFNLTINGNFNFPDAQVFDYTGVGVVSALAVPSRIHPQWFSSNFNGTAINRAIATIGATAHILDLNRGAYTLDAAVSVASTTHLEVAQGTTIDLVGFNFTIGGSYSLPDNQCFDQSAAGLVVFSRITKIKPQWFASTLTGTAINEALDSISTTEHTLFLDRGSYTLDVAVTVPDTAGLEIAHGVLITLGNFDLTINGPHDLPLSYIFNESGTGAVNFGADYLITTFPQWWNAQGDGSTDDSDAFDSAIAALPATGGKVLLPHPSVSYKASGMIIPNEVYVEGVVPETRIIPAADEDVFAFDTTTNVVRAGIRNVVIDGSATKGSFTSQSGISLVAGAGFFLDTINIEHVRVIDSGDRGIEVIGGTGTPNTQFVQRLRMEDVSVVTCTNSGLLIQGFVIETVLHRVDVTGSSVDGADAESNVAMILNGVGQPQRLRWTGGIIHAQPHTTGNALYISGAASLYFGTVDFEDAPTSVKIVQAISKNITFDTCRWGAALGITNIFELNRVNNLVVMNCRDGGPITNAFNFTGTEDNVTDFVEIANDFSASTNRYVWWSAALRISSGAYQVSSPEMLSRIDGEGLVADNLSVIYDSAGALTRFKDGQIIILAANDDADTITVLDLTDGGAETGANIRLVGAATGDFDMDSIRDRIALQYDEKLGEFIEIWRADIL